MGGLSSTHNEGCHRQEAAEEGMDVGDYILAHHL
jgi:hypothetical protein